MHNLLLNKMALSGFSALIFIGLFAATTPSVHADIAYQPYDDNQINIKLSDNDQEKKYQVNGKTFYWRSLTPEQKAKIKAVEDKLKSVEKRFQTQEKQLNVFASQIEQKAREIENEARKLERVSIEFDQDSINMGDLHRIADELAKLTHINEKLIHQKENELREVEEQLHSVDLSLIKDIEKHARALESVLIEIAEQI